MTTGPGQRIITFSVTAVLLAAAVVLVTSSFRGYHAPAGEAEPANREGGGDRADGNQAPACSSLQAGTAPPSQPLDRANAGRTGNFDSPAVPELTEIKWQYQHPLPELPGLSAPVVAGDTVFVAGEVDDPRTGQDDFSGLYAIDAATGRVRWRHFIVSEYRPETGQAAPAVTGGTVYYGVPVSDKLYAVDAETGKEKWSFPLGEGGAVFSSPLAVNGTVYVAGGTRYFFALDAATGSEKWRYQAESAVIAAPALADGLVYFGDMDGTLYALDAATGAERWRFASGGEVSAPPAVEDGTVYFTSGDGNLYALNAANGALRWSRDTGYFQFRALAVADGMVFVNSGSDIAGSRFAMAAIDAGTGEKLWEYGYRRFASSPSVAGGAVYFTSDDNFHALDAHSGRECWSFEAGMQQSPAAIADGVVYFTTFNGIVYALQ